MNKEISEISYEIRPENQPLILETVFSLKEANEIKLFKEKLREKKYVIWQVTKEKLGEVEEE